MQRKHQLIVVAVGLLTLCGFAAFEPNPDWDRSIAESEGLRVGQHFDDFTAALGAPYTFPNETGGISHCYGAYPQRMMRVSQLTDRYLGLPISADPGWWPVEVRYDKAARARWLRRGRTIVTATD
jgi:hypothetical protein